jgi:hypothetical protein
LIREVRKAVREVLEVLVRLVLRVLLVRLVHLVHLVRLVLLGQRVGLEAKAVLLVAMVDRHRAVPRLVVPRRVVLLHLLRVVHLHLLLVGLRLLGAPILHLQMTASLLPEILLQVAGRVVLHRLRRRPVEVLDNVLEEATWAGSRLLDKRKRSLREWPCPEAPG